MLSSARIWIALCVFLLALAAYWTALGDYTQAVVLFTVAALLFVRVQYDDRKRVGRQMTPKTFAIYGAAFLALAVLFAVLGAEEDVFTSSSARALSIVAAVLFLLIGVASFMARSKLIAANRKGT